ncbi:hypothetical protein V8E36_008265 [Tilletia maclaganii]
MTSSNRHRPRLMRAPHTSPPLPATTSLLVSHCSTARDDAESDRYDPLSSPSFNYDQGLDEFDEHDQQHLITMSPQSNNALRLQVSPEQPQQRSTNRLERLPQELILHILGFVHHDLVYPSDPCDKTYFQPLEQRQQSAHLTLLRLAAVCPQFESAILGPQASVLWHRIDGSAVFPVPRPLLADALEAPAPALGPRHLSPALFIALARAAGPAVTSLSLRGIQFSSVVEPKGGIGSLFTAAHLFEHVLEAQGVCRTASDDNKASASSDGPSHQTSDDSNGGMLDGPSSSQRVFQDKPLSASPGLMPLSLPVTTPPAPQLRVTQLTHLDLRSIRIDPVQIVAAKRALSALLSASPNISSLLLANANAGFVDDNLLDSSLPNPHKLRELDVSRCAGVTAEGLNRLLRKIGDYQSERLQAGDTDRAHDAGLQIVRIVGMRAKPLSGAIGDTGRTHRHARAEFLDAMSDEEHSSDERPQDDIRSPEPARRSVKSPLEEMMALIGQTSAHTLQVLDASYVNDLTDSHILALAHVMPQHSSGRKSTIPFSTASNGPLRQSTITQAQIKLSRDMACAKHFPTHRSALARALDAQSSTTNIVTRTVFPHLRSLALASNPYLTAASCGFLTGALPACETLELAGWSSRAFLDHERDADGRRIRRDTSRAGRAAATDLPGDGPLVDLLESMPQIRRVDLEGASEITDAVLRILTPSPSIRYVGEDGGQLEEEQAQPGQFLSHLIVSHAYRLSPRAMLDLMRGATKLVHLELDDTRAGCDHVAKEWATLMRLRKSGLKAAASALALPLVAAATATVADGQGVQERRAMLAESPTPYLSLVDCRGFSKDEYDRLSRKGQVRAREAIGLRPKLAPRPADAAGVGVEPSAQRTAVGHGVHEALEEFEWGREWFGYEGRAEITPVNTEGSPASSHQHQTALGPVTTPTTPSAAPSEQQAASPSRASRLALSLPLGLGLALARRASGHLTTSDEDDDANNATSVTQLSLPGLSFQIRASAGGGAGSGGANGDAIGQGGCDETNPALGVLKSFWGWQAIDVRGKARKKRLAKEEKARKIAATAAAAASASARAGSRPGGARSLSFGGLDAALRNADAGTGQEQGGSAVGLSTGLRNSTAAALALLLRRTGASSAGAAMSAAFGPMTPPLSRSPSPASSPSSPAGLAAHMSPAGIPIPGAAGGRGQSSPRGGMRAGLSRRMNSGSSAAGGGFSPSTPGAQSTMSAFSFMALAGQRGGAIPSSSFGSGRSLSGAFSPSTPPSWERASAIYSARQTGSERHDRPSSSTRHISTRHALAFAEAAAAAGLSPTEAEMLAMAAIVDHSQSPRSRTRSDADMLSAVLAGGAMNLNAAGKRPRQNSSRFGGDGYPGDPLLLDHSPTQFDFRSGRVAAPGGRSLRDKVRQHGDRAKGRIRKLLHTGSTSASASTGGRGVETDGASSVGSHPASGAATPRRGTAPHSLSAGRVPSSSVPSPSLPTAAAPGATGAVIAPQYYGTDVAGLEGMGWDDDEENDLHGCVLM